MGSLPLQVWIDNLGWMEVEALGHTVDLYSGAQMGPGITGTYSYNIRMKLNIYFRKFLTYIIISP